MMPVEKPYKLQFTKTKNFKRMKRQARDREEKLANHISNKQLVSGTYKKLSKPNIKKTNPFKSWFEGAAVLRWQMNRTGRPFSPSQIHQKNISMLSKFYKTTSECWQRTSGTQKSRSLSSKTVNLSGCPSMWRNFSSLT